MDANVKVNMCNECIVNHVNHMWTTHILVCVYSEVHTLQKSGGYYPPKRVKNVCPKLAHLYSRGNQTPQWFSLPTQVGHDQVIIALYMVTFK